MMEHLATPAVRPPLPLRIARTAALLLLTLCATSCHRPNAQDAFPSQPIMLVVPFGAGGGTDTYARIIKQAIEEEELLEQPLVIVNIAGAGATTGSRRVKEAAPDGYSVLILHDTIITAQISGAADYGPEAFEPIAGTGEVGMVIAVDGDSPYQTLSDLLEAARDKPDTIGFGHNQGALTHFAALQLQQQMPGAQFRLAHIGGGAERFSNLKAGHIGATGFSIEEFSRFRTDNLRGVAYFGPERHPAAPRVPTAVEQGFDILSVNTFYWWYPKNTPPERVDHMARVLEQAMQTDLVQERMKEIFCEPIFIRGAELEARISESRRRLSQVRVDEADPLPMLPEILAGLVVLCLAASLWSERSRARSRAPLKFRPRYDLALGVVACTAVYTAALGNPLTAQMDYRLITSVFMACCGALLVGRDAKRLLGVAVLAAAAPLVVHLVFTQVLEIKLPGS